MPYFYLASCIWIFHFSIWYIYFRNSVEQRNADTRSFEYRVRGFERKRGNETATGRRYEFSDREPLWQKNEKPNPVIVAISTQSASNFFRFYRFSFIRQAASSLSCKVFPTYKCEYTSKAQFSPFESVIITRAKVATQTNRALLLVRGKANLISWHLKQSNTIN